jgi:hypothetical protein
MAGVKQCSSNVEERASEIVDVSSVSGCGMMHFLPTLRRAMEAVEIKPTNRYSVV